MKRLTALAALAAALMAAPAAAAADLEVARGCDAEGDALTVAGSGFTPTGPVTLGILRGRTLLDETLDPLADTEGRVRGTFSLPTDSGWFQPRQRRFGAVVFLRDQQRLLNFDLTSITLSRWTVMVDGVAGRRIAPGRPTAITAVGWTHAVGEPLYAHHVVGGRRRRTVRLGVVRGACGDLRATLPPLAGGRVVFGTEPRSHLRGPVVSVRTLARRRGAGR